MFFFLFFFLLHALDQYFVTCYFKIYSQNKDFFIELSFYKPSPSLASCSHKMISLYLGLKHPTLATLYLKHLKKWPSCHPGSVEVHSFVNIYTVRWILGFALSCTGKPRSTATSTWNRKCCLSVFYWSVTGHAASYLKHCSPNACAQHRRSVQLPWCHKARQQIRSCVSLEERRTAPNTLHKMYSG